MKNPLVKLVVWGSPFFLGQQLAAQSDEAAVKNAVHAYFKAMNAADLTGVVAAFAEDGVLLPSAAPTARGTEQLSGNYTYVFDNFGFALEETIESAVVTGDRAVVRSTSSGKLTIKASGAEVADNFREVFVLKKVNGAWKIDTYMYNQSK